MTKPPLIRWASALVDFLAFTVTDFLPPVLFGVIVLFVVLSLAVGLGNLLATGFYELGRAL